MRALNAIRLFVFFEIGLLISATVAQLTCIVLASQLNYFSGRDPASLFLDLPTFLLVEHLAAFALLGGLRLFRVPAPNDASTLLVLGLLLGQAALGFAAEMLTRVPGTWVLLVAAILAACVPVLIESEGRASSATRTA